MAIGLCLTLIHLISIPVTAYGRTPLTQDTLHWLPEVLVGSFTPHRRPSRHADSVNH